MSSRFFKVGEFTTFVHTRYLGTSLPLIHVAKQSLRSVNSCYLVFISWGNSKNSMWLSFGVSSRYLCVYFQEIRKTQHLLIRSAICHTVRRLHSAPRSLRCMCKWVVLEITKHRLGRLSGVHLAPIFVFGTLIVSQSRTALSRTTCVREKLLQDSLTPCLVFYAYNRQVLSTIHICELHDGVESNKVSYLPPLSRWRLYDRKGLSVRG